MDPFVINRWRFYSFLFDLFYFILLFKRMIPAYTIVMILQYTIFAFIMFNWILWAPRKTHQWFQYCLMTLLVIVGPRGLPLSQGRQSRILRPGYRLYNPSNWNWYVATVYIPYQAIRWMHQLIMQLYLHYNTSSVYKCRDSSLPFGLLS